LAVSGSQLPCEDDRTVRVERLAVLLRGKESAMGTFKDLIGYKKAFALALEVRKLTRKFPREELYTLTDQVHRSSRGICTNLAEGYRKRRYVAHFIAKITDSDAECAESIVHLDFALAFGFITEDEHKQWSPGLRRSVGC